MKYDILVIGGGPAGVVAALGNNGLGIAGIAYNCKILPVKILSGDSGVTNDALAEAIRYGPTNELQDPEFNISYGTRMLSQLVTKTGSLREGLKRYGPMDVGYDYADKVLNIYEQNGDQENR